jgi:putative transposase
MRYVERNPSRAGLVSSAAKWRRSSLGQRNIALEGPALADGPVARPENWLEYVDQPETERELPALRRCVVRGSPFGSAGWQTKTPDRLDLQSSLKPVCTPMKAAAKES